MGQYTINNIELRAEVLKNDIDNIYKALNTKIGNSPKTLDRVPEWILNIPGRPIEEPLTITPSVDGQEFSTSVDTKYNPITVEPVTSSIDSNIQPENIKLGVSILGVSGILSGGESNVFVVPNGMKFGYSNLTEIPSNFNFTGVTDMENMFCNCPQLTSIPQLNTSGVGSMSHMFEGCISLTSIPQLDTSGVYYMDSTFSGCSGLTTIPDLNTSDVHDMNHLFSGCSSLTSIPQLNTSSVENMDNMFAYCLHLTSIPQLNYSMVNSMENIFQECSSLTTIPRLDIPNVSSLNGMFHNCSNLTTIEGINPSSIWGMNNTFAGCSSLTAIPQLDTSTVSSMQSAFANCSSLTTIPQFDFSSAGDISFLFDGCTGLTSLPQLNTSHAYNMEFLFEGCENLTTVEGIDFSGLSAELSNLIGYKTDMSKLTRFIVNGKINVSIPDNGNINVLTAIDYDSVKSILAAADRTDNTDAKTLAFNRTMTDQNGELAALVASCSTKGWTITGLTLQ